MRFEDNLFEFSDFDEKDDFDDSEFEKIFERENEQKGFSHWDIEYDDV